MAEENNPFSKYVENNTSLFDDALKANQCIWNCLISLPVIDLPNISLNLLTFICIDLLNLVVEIEVFDTFATIESELKKFEYLEPVLKNNRLIPNSIPNTNAIFDLLKILNIYFYDIACIIIASIKESKLWLI